MYQRYRNLLLLCGGSQNSMRNLWIILLLLAPAAYGQSTTTVNVASAVVPLDIALPAGCTAKLTAPVGSHQLLTVACTTTPPPPPPPVPLSITSPVTLPAAQQGKAYSASLATLAAPKGGKSPYTFLQAAGLPKGLTMSTAGIISGTPTESGTFTVSYIVQDSSTATTTFTIDQQILTVSGR